MRNPAVTETRGKKYFLKTRKRLPILYNGQGLDSSFPQFCSYLWMSNGFANSFELENVEVTKRLFLNTPSMRNPGPLSERFRQC